jgi:hypothetical protein
MLDYIVERAKDAVGMDRLVAVHAGLGRIEWREEGARNI